MITWIDEAGTAGARRTQVCQTLGLTVRTVQRWRAAGEAQPDGRPAAAPRRTPANARSPAERAQLLATVNRPACAACSPQQSVPLLADHGEYLASASTRYRLLRAAGQLARRGRAKPPTRQRPTPLVATAPHQVWTWDLTDLATTVRGSFCYRYLILDLFSRKIVGWEVPGHASADQAAALFRQSQRREGVDRGALTRHADNGAPMKGATMLATLHRLGVVPSFSRPAVSNDNPCSAALFRTLKYTPAYPDAPCEEIAGARRGGDLRPRVQRAALA